MIAIDLTTIATRWPHGYGHTIPASRPLRATIQHVKDRHLPYGDACLDLVHAITTCEFEFVNDVRTTMGAFGGLAPREPSAPMLVRLVAFDFQFVMTVETWRMRI